MMVVMRASGGYCAMSPGRTPAPEARSPSAYARGGDAIIAAAGASLRAELFGPPRMRPWAIARDYASRGRLCGNPSAVLIHGLNCELRLLGCGAWDGCMGSLQNLRLNRKPLVC